MTRTGAFVLLAALVTLAAACHHARPPRQLGDALPGLTPDEAQRFAEGKKEFERTFAPETGVGPLFNADACAECHEEPVTGGPGDEVETHVAVYDAAHAFCDQLVDKGGPVIQHHATPALTAAMGIDKEPIPASATVIASRSTPGLFGFGLLDAVPDATILALADPDDRNHDGIRGRPNRSIDGRLGRFGRKAFVPSLHEFTAGAFPVEQGVTDPESPEEQSIGGLPIPPGVDPTPDPEITQQSLDRTIDFVRFLAPPPSKPLDAAGRRGKSLFASLGCAACHVPALRTGDDPVKALRYKRVYAYTDLLLHEMSPELSDICFGQATPSEFRTAPLMGLSLSTSFLHDGRAKTLDEAIRLHGGEALAARNRYASLSPRDQEAVVKFLGSL